MSYSLRKITKSIGVLSLCVFGLLLSGCASSVPDMSNIERVTKDALTPSELKEAINDMTLEQKKHRDASGASK